MTTPAPTPTLHRRLIVEHLDATQRFSIQLNQYGYMQTTTAVTFEDPMSKEDRNDLRWYLEEYLKQPDDAAQGRARAVERQMRAWGGRMFDLLFGHGQPGRDVYLLLRARGLADAAFELRYQRPAIGNLPWELLYDTDQGAFLVQQFGAFSRLRQGKVVSLREPRAAGQELRVLLVIARPFGRGDIPYRTVVGPVMELLRQPHLRRRIRVEVLRPATFRAFQEQLGRRREDGAPFFDLVHFDGHGGVDFGRSYADYLETGDLPEGPRGKLLFETEDGRTEPIYENDLREWLGQHRVPLILLNACRSGTEGLPAEEVEATLAEFGDELVGEKGERVRQQLAEHGRVVQSIAGTLLNGGADGVVSMAYMVKARAAAVFMKGFYGRLLEGGSSAEAVTAGRLGLVTSNQRPSPQGEMPLEDWPVPIYHESMSVTLFQPPPAGTDADALFAALLAGQPLPETPAGDDDSLPAPPRHGFLGRDRELLGIDRGLRRAGMAGVALSGPAGGGKTALAVHAARWLVATHAPQVDDGVYFVPGTGADALARLVTLVGQRRFGVQFDGLQPADQLKVVRAHLHDDSCLLILDGLDDAEPPGLGELLGSVCHSQGNTRILVTSRQAPAWLQPPLEPLPLAGLDGETAADLAAQVLRQALGAEMDDRMGDSTWRTGYRHLLKRLAGNPRDLEMVLPRLKERWPAEVMAELDAPVDEEA